MLNSPPSSNSPTLSSPLAAPVSRSLRAVYMRGGPGKGLFLHEADLPRRGELRDRLLMRLMGCPDPQGRGADGFGGGNDGPAKVVIVSPSKRPEYEVEFQLGTVHAGADQARIDWSGNCSDLSAAVAPFAIHEGLCKASDGIARVRMWQRNLEQRIDALVPVQGGQVLEHGQFQDEGVPFKGAEIRLEFHEPEPDEQAMAFLPTGQTCDELKVPGLGKVRVTMVNAGQPTVFIRGDVLDLNGKELPETFKRAQAKLKLLEAIRLQAAVAMGISPSDALASGHRTSVPAITWVARPASYRSSDGSEFAADQIDVLARSLAMGKLHPSYSSAGSIALAAAAALPGSVVNEITRTLPGVATRIGHVSGTLAVGAEVSSQGGVWRLDMAVLSRSARRLMSGWVHWPNDVAGC